MPDSNYLLLCSKLCWHNYRKPIEGFSKKGALRLGLFFSVAPRYGGRLSFTLEVPVEDSFLYSTLGKKTQFTKAVNYRERTTVLCKLQENWSLQIVGPFAMVYKVVNML